VVIAAALSLGAADALADGYGKGRHGHGHGRHHSRSHQNKHFHHGNGHRHHGHAHRHHSSLVIVSRPPVYYAPPRPVVYAAPAPVYVAPPAYAAPVTLVPASPVYQTADGQYCREYQSVITVGGLIRDGYGTACYEPDGTWRIVR
jgi:hypothetical protein